MCVEGGSCRIAGAAKSSQMTSCQFHFPPRTIEIWVVPPVTNSYIYLFLSDASLRMAWLMFPSPSLPIFCFTIRKCAAKCPHWTHLSPESKRCGSAPITALTILIAALTNDKATLDFAHPALRRNHPSWTLTSCLYAPLSLKGGPGGGETPAPQHSNLYRYYEALILPLYLGGRIPDLCKSPR
jgi:hypothetical protein